MSFDQYKSGYDKMEVPPELIKKTSLKMKAAAAKSENRVKIGRGWYVALGALCVMIAVLLPTLLRTRNNSIILTELNDFQYTQRVKVKNGSLIFHSPDGAVLTILPHLGTAGPSAQSAAEPSVNVVTTKGSLPEQYDETLDMDSVINGIPMYVGVTGHNSFFAQFTHNGVGYYITGENITQKAFIEKIYEILR